MVVPLEGLPLFVARNGWTEVQFAVWGGDKFGRSASYIMYVSSRHAYSCDQTAEQYLITARSSGPAFPGAKGCAEIEL